jgi:5-methylcytosine-specific restriction endonuclease McrA
MKLTIELVPSTCWYTNVRSNVGRKEWDRIRKEVYKKANNKCEICGGQGLNWPVEAHEIFEYDDKLMIQKLVRIIALCQSCHKVKHIGLSQLQGMFQESLQHLAKVNKWTKEEARQYIEEQFKLWQARSKFQWKLDLTLLEVK